MYCQREHRKGAEGIPFLDFYSLYPTKDNTDATGIRSGYFENLIQYCGAGFKRSQVIPAYVSKHERVFSWDENTLKK